MKAVMISIQPKWCELIASGKKTVEVRKSKPKLKTPFKCYIYCTKGKSSADFITKSEKFGYLTGHEGSFYNRATEYDANGKVIGEFVCDKIQDMRDVDQEPTCLSIDEWLKYTDGHKGAVYGWHISDLVIYDKPRELGEFYAKCKTMVCEGCEHLKYQQVNSDERDYDCEYLNGNIPLSRPPQSWCYVEEVIP